MDYCCLPPLVSLTVPSLYWEDALTPADVSLIHEPVDVALRSQTVSLLFDALVFVFVVFQFGLLGRRE